MRATALAVLRTLPISELSTGAAATGCGCGVTCTAGSGSGALASWRGSLPG